MSRKVINVVAGGTTEKTLKLTLNFDELQTTITEYNFSHFFGITYEEYLTQRNDIKNFTSNILMFNDGTLLYDILLFSAEVYKANMPNASIIDYYTSTTGSIGYVKVSIESNEDKSFKSCTVEFIEATEDN